MQAALVSAGCGWVLHPYHVRDARRDVYTRAPHMGHGASGTTRLRSTSPPSPTGGACCGDGHSRGLGHTITWAMPSEACAALRRFPEERVLGLPINFVTCERIRDAAGVGFRTWQSNHRFVLSPTSLPIARRAATTPPTPPRRRVPASL